MSTIVVAGTISDGFTFHGPFADFDEACEWAERETSTEWWGATLHPPNLAAAVNEATTLTPYLAIGMHADGAWELAGVFQADDRLHAYWQAEDAEPDKVEWIIVPTEHVYRKAIA